MNTNALLIARLIHGQGGRIAASVVVVVPNVKHERSYGLSLVVQDALLLLHCSIVTHTRAQLIALSAFGIHGIRAQSPVALEAKFATAMCKSVPNLGARNAHHRRKHGTAALTIAPSLVQLVNGPIGLDVRPLVTSDPKPTRARS
jgi:hypothetical protein